LIPKIKWAAPVSVTGPHSFFLLAIWSQRPYAAGVETALERYRQLISEGPAVVAGDFNQNAVWDRPNRTSNHSRNVELLGNLGLVSAYHHYFGVSHGAERHTTHYWRGQTENEPIFHIDYCFVPKVWLKRIESVRLGSFSKWVASGLSDHVPLIVDVWQT
jgi:endonuclease/exonuclease/phosphatase family metal-dependent hydrolase